MCDFARNYITYAVRIARAVDLFLKDRIGFIEIAGLVEDVLNACDACEPKSLDDEIGYIELARVRACELADKICPPADVREGCSYQ
ncbi:MAG: hypothetical protein IJS39_05250 [Synergistaceae bacterium]|nr:hypothetical protein [Synergistaceae bacterium]